jgi:TonB-dependent siderophore receptor
MNLLHKFLFISFLSFLGFNSGFAQIQSGSIKGKVTDSLNLPVHGVSIHLIGTNYGTHTDKKGEYVLSNIPSGNYIMSIELLGFETQERDVVVKVNDFIRLDYQLKFSVKELEVVSITATGIKEQIKDVPSTINVIDQKQIQESGAQSVGQIITRVPGVNYLDEDGRGIKPNIGLRGLDPLRNRNLLVLIDGKFPIGMTYYGDPAAYYMIPIQQLDCIEVIKGASPVLYGGYSVGGVINMITKSGKCTPERNLSLSYGSWNSLNTQFSAGADNGKTGYYLSGLRRQGDGYRSRSAFGINDYTAKVVTRPDSTSELSLYLNGFTEQSQTPGGITQKQFEDNPRQSNHKNDQFIGKRFSGAISYQKNINRYHKISTSVYGNYFQRDWWIAYKRSDTTNGFLRDIHALGTVVDYNFNKDILGKKNSFIAGVRVHTDRLDDMGVGGDTAIARTGKTTSNRINTSFIYEGFIYDEFSLSKNLSIAPGLRYTNVQYHRNDLVNNRIDEIKVDALVYSFGAIYKIKSSRVYATVSRGFNPPSLNSSLDPNTIKAGVDLKPEISHNYEVGFRANPTHWFSLNTALYTMFFKNKVVTQGGISQNAGNSHHRGVEAELELGPWRGVRFFANSAIQKATFTSGVDNGKILPYAPQFLGSAGIRYQLFFENSNIVINVYDNYVGKQYNDTKNTEAGTADGTNGAIPAYNVLNATVNYNRKHYTLFVNGMNLLNEKYFTMRFAASSWTGIIPAPTRNFMAGVNFKF